jgi:CheY-like chemotaxis protein
MNGRTRILIVDDDPMLLSLLTDTLESIGYETLSVNSGEEAIETVSTVEIDVVVADINLPGMDGIETMRSVKNISPCLPVILITGVNMKGIVTRAYSAGADGFLDKPFRIAVIEEMIQRLLGHTALESSAIMVIDDDAEMLESLRSELQAIGYDVTTAASGSEALLRLREGRVGTVITDFIMPGMDGVELANCIREFSPSTHVVIYTGYKPSEKERREITSVADAFLSKPFRFRDMTDTLDRLKAARTAAPSTIVGL